MSGPALRQPLALSASLSLVFGDTQPAVPQPDGREIPGRSAGLTFTPDTPAPGGHRVEDDGVAIDLSLAPEHDILPGAAGSTSPTSALFEYGAFASPSHRPAEAPVMSQAPNLQPSSGELFDPLHDHRSPAAVGGAAAPAPHCPASAHAGDPSEFRALNSDSILAAAEGVTGSQAFDSFEMMESLITDAHSSPFSLSLSVPGSSTPTPTRDASDADVPKYGSKALHDFPIEPFAAEAKLMLGDPLRGRASPVPSRAASRPLPMDSPTRVRAKASAGGSKQAIAIPKAKSTPAQKHAESGRRVAKTPTKRKPRTYSRAVPSQHCHICSRRPTEESPHAACGNLNKGKCRKTICRKCFVQYGWDVEAARDAEATGWVCPHCQGFCPERAQCHIYDRTSERRRNKTVNHRKPKAAGDGGAPREAVNGPDAPLTMELGFTVPNAQRPTQMPCRPPPPQSRPQLQMPVPLPPQLNLAPPPPAQRRQKQCATKAAKTPKAAGTAESRASRCAGSAVVSGADAGADVGGSAPYSDHCPLPAVKNATPGTVRTLRGPFASAIDVERMQGAESTALAAAFGPAFPSILGGDGDAQAADKAPSVGQQVAPREQMLEDLMATINRGSLPEAPSADQVLADRGTPDADELISYAPRTGQDSFQVCLDEAMSEYTAPDQLV
jgi:hypothetical protein